MMAEYKKLPYAKCIFEGCTQFDKCARAQDATSAEINYSWTCNDGNCFKWWHSRESIEIKVVPKEESENEHRDGETRTVDESNNQTS